MLFSKLFDTTLEVILGISLNLHTGPKEEQIISE